MKLRSSRILRFATSLVNSGRARYRQRGGGMTSHRARRRRYVTTSSCPRNVFPLTNVRNEQRRPRRLMGSVKQHTRSAHTWYHLRISSRLPNRSHISRLRNGAPNLTTNPYYGPIRGAMHSRTIIFQNGSGNGGFFLGAGNNSARRSNRNSSFGGHHPRRIRILPGTRTIHFIFLYRIAPLSYQCFQS